MTVEQMIEHVQNSINRALAGEGDVPPDVMAVRGFATPTQRRLANLLCEGVDCYLEVGLYAGATFIAAMHGNPHLTAIGVENRSQDFCVPEAFKELEANLRRWGREPRVLDVVWGTHTDAAPTIKGPVQCYYFDGEHGRPSQASALSTFIHAMDDVFVFIVDDTDWDPVRDGTADGFAALADKVKVEKCWQFSQGRPDGDIWHNGVHIYVCSKI